VRRDQVGFQAHQLAPGQADERGPGDIDDLVLLLKGRDARRCAVAFLILPVSGATEPAQARAEAIADADVDQAELAPAARPVDSGPGPDLRPVLCADC